MSEKTFKIIDEAGIHARPATLLVNTASKFLDAEITIKCGDKQGNLKSIMGVMSLGVKQNDEITINASGTQSAEAIIEIEKVLTDSSLI